MGVTHYDASNCPCCGKTCLQCFEGQPFFLCITLTGHSCTPWNTTPTVNRYCMMFLAGGGDNCTGSGFTIEQACGIIGPGMTGSWIDNQLCVTIGGYDEAAEKPYVDKYCGRVSCNDLVNGVVLPQVEGTGGGILHVKFGGFDGCASDCWETGLLALRQALTAGEEGLRVARPITPHHGPGTELTAMLKEIGAEQSSGCGCASLAARMNRWGVDGCKARRYEILGHLTHNAANIDLFQLLKMGAKSMQASWFGAINPINPIGSLLDEAIRRAEKSDQ